MNFVEVSHQEDYQCARPFRSPYLCQGCRQAKDRVRQIDLVTADARQVPWYFEVHSKGHKLVGQVVVDREVQDHTHHDLYHSSRVAVVHEVQDHSRRDLYHSNRVVEDHHGNRHGDHNHPFVVDRSRLGLSCIQEGVHHRVGRICSIQDYLENCGA